MGWDEFCRIYVPLIQSVALKSGCTRDESEEVVQETLISLSKEMPKFKPDPSHGSFSGWLMRITERRIIDQLRKRPPAGRFAELHAPATSTPPMNRIPDTTATLDESWETDRQKLVLKRAMERLKTRVQPGHFKIFYLAVMKDQSVQDVAKALGVSRAQVYLVKHRLSALLKRETIQLERIASAPVASPVLQPEIRRGHAS